MHGTSPRLVPIEAPSLALPGIAHAFFTREGGVSTGLYLGLNTGIGSNDTREAVLENRSRAARHLGTTLDLLATPHQVHSPDVVRVDDVWEPGRGPKADAVVTNRPGIAVGVGAADCGPVLFADPKARVVGAAHSGWKGALSGVLGSTIQAMVDLGATRENIIAVLGPAISSDAYEVGPEFAARFIDDRVENALFFSPSERVGHTMFDLPAYIMMRLQAEGLDAVANVDLCTYSDEARFYSYRRATHRGEPDYGRLLSAISLTGG